MNPRKADLAAAKIKLSELQAHSMKTLALLCLAAVTGPVLAAAQVLDIAWTPEGRFAHATTLAAKEVLEVCGKLPLRSHIQWSFEASAPLAFNIHVHQGKKVVYAARLEQADRAQGRQRFDAEPAHCWMWTNAGAAGVKVEVELRR
ncbi:hypothetical protein [Roseateles sp.]|uniref:hypothetical protein n=1 Tax=Roseateles sp. TaxID=1971397 RepID=UPI003266475B